MVSHQTIKFGGYKHCGSGGIVVFVYYRVSPDSVMKDSCNFMGESS